MFEGSVQQRQVGVAPEVWSLIEKHLHVNKFENSGVGLWNKLSQLVSSLSSNLQPQWTSIKICQFSTQIRGNLKGQISMPFHLATSHLPPCSLLSANVAEWTLAPGWRPKWSGWALVRCVEDDFGQTVHLHFEDFVHLWGVQAQSGQGSDP